MKIAILGAGAMGSVYGAILARAGDNDVWLVDRWQDHIDAIRAQGLKVTGASGDWLSPSKATTDPAEAGLCELVIVATKTRDIEAALAGAAPMIGPDTLVLSIQNGLGAYDILVKSVAQDRLLLGIAGGFGATIPTPGHVHHNGFEIVKIGATVPEAQPAAEAVAKVWADAGFRAEAAPDIQSMIWSKLICNVTYSAVCGITGLTIGQVMETPEAWRVASACASEAFAVARARGIALSFADPVAYVHKFGSAIPGAKPSLLLDRLAGRQGEIDFLNGAVADEGAKLGVPTPTNAIVAGLVRAMEAHDMRPASHKN